MPSYPKIVCDDERPVQGLRCLRRLSHRRQSDRRSSRGLRQRRGAGRSGPDEGQGGLQAGGGRIDGW